MEEDIENQFRPFRRYCMMLTTQPSQPVLEKLQEITSKSDPNVLQNLQEYIMLPMQIYLRSPNMPENYTISVLNFIRDLYASVTLTSKFLMTDILQNLLPLLAPNDLQVSSESGSNKKNPRMGLSEDMKIAICASVTNLIRATDDCIKSDVLYNQDYKLPISHLIFQVLEWSETENITEVILASLKLVNELCFDRCLFDPNSQTCEKSGMLDAKVKCDFLSQFTQMLPGITSRLMKILSPKKSSSNEKHQSFKIKANVLMVWCNYVCAIFNDMNMCSEDIMETDKGICDTSINNSSSSNNFLRNAEWIGKAQDHLLQHLQLLSKYNFITSEKLCIRNMMLMICEATINYCSGTLKCCNSLQIEILAILCVHPMYAMYAN